MADVKEKKITEKQMFELLADGKITQEIVELAKKKSAKEVGERLDLDSRKVSPTLVRMVKEGKIQKVSENPNTYQI